MNQPYSEENFKEHYLYPGNLFASKVPHMITTVLGSCVSICFYDKVMRIGGMNHYMLPFWNGEGLASPRYGNIAVPKLLEKMEMLGCRKHRLIAKVFGGGEVLAVSNNVLNVGERNILYANDILEELKIPVASMDVGGPTGRRIKFNSESGKVLMKRLNKQVDDIKV